MKITTDTNKLPSNLLAIRAVASGADDTATLERARHELASYADRKAYVQRFNKRGSCRPMVYSAAREALISTVRADYDAIVSILVSRAVA